MADLKRASKRLVTSKGIIAAGEEVKGLPKDEMAIIEKAGGLAAPGERIVTTEAQRVREALEYLTTVSNEASSNLETAEANLKAAKTDAEKKVAEKALALAKERVDALEMAQQEADQD